ncbi:hypothetical protein AXF42_Ash020668 [Apostasia shenzhenica]|uniref:Uncharacterized protein n=1 Tax=Apostasia shenzhenica TaxID=1088818 RepID=A0A2H9ZW09_9ASPA|nr:hypothetical protein AXF42_Ash020668 [Apostasia shenzhenica]
MVLPAELWGCPLNFEAALVLDGCARNCEDELETVRLHVELQGCARNCKAVPRLLKELSGFSRNARLRHRIARFAQKCQARKIARLHEEL